MISGTKVQFDILCGCRQGGLESPTLFNYYFDFLLKVCTEEIYRWMGLSFKNHMYRQNVPPESREEKDGHACYINYQVDSVCRRSCTFLS